MKLMNAIARKPVATEQDLLAIVPIRKLELGLWVGLWVGEVVCDAQGPGNESRPRKG